VARQYSGGAGADVMASHAHAVDGNLATLATMWFGMMAAMMAPTAWPWVRAYHRFGVARRGAEALTTTQFAAGYLLAWLVYAIAVAFLQKALQRTALMDRSGDAAVPGVAAIILLIAGIYQFAPIKRACLTHCRTPLGYFLTRWIDGPVGPVRMGIHHGFFCVGCCWALMTTALAVGAMNLWWMAALGIVALLEQTMRRGELLRRALGAAFIVAGIWQLRLTAIG